AGDVLSRTRARALKEHVLDKVGDAIGLRRLAAGTGFDPHAHSHRTQVLHALSQDDQAIRQYGTAKISLIIHFRQVEFDCRATEVIRHAAGYPAVMETRTRKTVLEVPGLQGKGKMLYADPSRDPGNQPTCPFRLRSPRSREPEAALWIGCSYAVCALSGFWRTCVAGSTARRSSLSATSCRSGLGDYAAEIPARTARRGRLGGRTTTDCANFPVRGRNGAVPCRAPKREFARKARDGGNGVDAGRRRRRDRRGIRFR